MTTTESGSFPKYQLSKFYDKARNLQAVFRTNDKEEYEAQLMAWTEEEEINKSLESSKNICATCGSQMIEGRNGKPYCKPCYIKWAEANKNKEF